MQFKVGDKIKVTVRDEDMTTTFEGVVARINSAGAAFTESGDWLGNDIKHAAVAVIERAVPPVGTHVKVEGGTWGVVSTSPISGRPIVVYFHTRPYDFLEDVDWEFAL